MIGIPYRLLRQGDTGPVDKVIYLATRRSGEAGKQVKQAKKQYLKQRHVMGKAFQKHATADRRVSELPADSERMDELIAQRDMFFDQLVTAEEKALEAAEKLVRLSLTEGYGREVADQIMDVLTDDDFHDMVVTIQTGEQPKDFFPSGDQPPKPTTTSPPGDSPPKSSSNTDSRGHKSGEAKSASTKPTC